MPRGPRIAPGDLCYHVISRGNNRATVFHDAQDYDHFGELIAAAGERRPIRLLAYCLMPNHIHLVLRPYADGDLGSWMRWLLTVHVSHHHRRHGTSGHVWQGRYKSFPIQDDAHLFTVIRYVERNPVRAGLVDRPTDWTWSSAVRRDVAATDGPILATLPLPDGWAKTLAQPETPAALERLRDCVNGGAPFGDAGWTSRTADWLRLPTVRRAPGRPQRRAAGPAARERKQAGKTHQ